jgi:hypothetical protein
MPTASADEAYVVYRVTPDMWEWPWIRQLLAALPISSYRSLDLRTRPVAHPRLRRISRGSQRFLPTAMRSTHRLWRRVIDPHDFSVFVYNTWALDPDMISELGTILADFDHVGLVSIDESTQDLPDVYKRVAFALRIGFDSEKYGAIPYLMIAPLGVPKHFVAPRQLKKIHEREFSWSFLGDVKNVSRRTMITELERVRGKRFLHVTSGWNADDSLRGATYSDVLANSIFVPSPSANVHCECYRTYEALECRAIPVVDTDYYREVFDAPFPVAGPAWEDAASMLNRWLDHPESLEKLDRECRGWWDSVKSEYPRRVRTLAEQGRMRSRGL